MYKNDFYEKICTRFKYQRHKSKISLFINATVSVNIGMHVSLFVDFQRNCNKIRCRLDGCHCFPIGQLFLILS